jgi:hypothetical protein
MPDHTSNMINLFVLILQSCCLCYYLFIFSCSIIIHVPCLFAYYIYMIHMFHVLLIHIVMDIFEIMISMIKHILYVIIIMLIYEIKIIRKMPIFLTQVTGKRYVYPLSPVTTTCITISWEMSILTVRPREHPAGSSLISRAPVMVIPRVILPTAIGVYIFSEENREEKRPAEKKEQERKKL